MIPADMTLEVSELFTRELTRVIIHVLHSIIAIKISRISMIWLCVLINVCRLCYLLNFFLITSVEVCVDLF